jgi:mannose-6-phosphate isomerase-like protein (cupin superfamily)
MKTLLLLLAAVSFAAFAHDANYEDSSSADSHSPLSDYVIKLEEMTAIEAGEGEKIYLLRGSEHGFRSLSFILTETAPGGGPPLHTHESEEAHVLTAGTMAYIVGDQRFEVSAPYILRVPANTPHTFINVGTSPLMLTAVFDSANYTFTPIAPNPLQVEEGASP